ncbi:PAS domain-containing protein [bacterium AH-315-P15]|nr:PAS domain-containing protein [bacterium AH-315-P15]
MAFQAFRKIERLFESGSIANRGKSAASVVHVMRSMPIAVLTCDISEDSRIDFANEATLDALRSIEHLLSCRADDIVGQSIDIFYKDPNMQRPILSDPRNLPHTAIIPLGDEYLELKFDAMYDNARNYLGPILVWSVVTERVKQETANLQLKPMLDDMPVNIMMADKDTLEVTYLNQTSVNTLRQIEHLLPVKADQVLGSCIDIFYKNPSHHRQLLRDPSNLPHTTRIKLGDESLRYAILAGTAFYVLAAILFIRTAPRLSADWEG